MKKYLLYSTLFSIFTEAAFIRVGFDFKLIYIIVFTNYFIINAVNGKIFIPKKWILVLSYIFLCGVISIFLYQNTFGKVAFQVFGISFMSIYFYNFFLCYDFDVFDIFKKYCYICYIMAIIAIAIAVFQYLVIHDFEYRAKGLLLEPAHFTAILLPALLYYLFNLKKYKFRTLIIAFAFVISFSSIGYMGLLFGILMLSRRVNFLIIIALVFVAFSLGFIAYSTIDNVKLRVNDTFGVFGHLDVTDVNWSTYALASNFYVTEQVLESNFLFGHGIGSHPISHSKYIGNLTGIETWDEMFTGINSEDANSLALRALSELGVIGFLGIIYFIAKNYSGEPDYYQFSRAIILYFIYKLLREGHYFSPEMYFFVFSYYFVKIKSVVKKERASTVSAYPVDLSNFSFEI